MADKTLNVSAIKVRANSLMKNGKYVEAIMEYSEGISLQPANPLLYSNRSLAFLKLAQYFFALKDAETTIRLVPDWPKGYYRKGQAELEVGMFEAASKTFDQGLAVCPGDEILMKALDDAKEKQKQYLQWKRRSLRRFAFLGSFIAVVLVIADMIFFKPHRPFLKTAVIRWIFVFFIATIFYILRSVWVAMEHANKASLLNPPAELSDTSVNSPLVLSQSDTEFSDCLSHISSTHLKYD